MVPNIRKDKDGQSNNVYFEIVEMSGSADVSKNKNKLSEESNSGKLQSKEEQFDEDKVDLT